MKYLVEEIYDENNNLTERVVKYKTDSRNKPRGKKFIFINGVDTKYPKINQDDNGNLTIIEDAVKKSESDIIADFESRIALRLERQDFGRRIIAVISELNESKKLTTPQIVKLSKDYADIRDACINGAIDTAKQLITVTVPDGTIITEDDKTALLNEINTNLTRLGYE